MKRVLEYKLPTWGIWVLAAVAVVSAFIAYIEFFFSFYTPALPSDIPRPVGIPVTQIIIMVYLAAVAILDLILAAGLVMHWNRARIITISLSPLPVIGVILDIIYQAWVNQLLATGPPGSVMQLQPLSMIASLLLVTGVSFPSLAPLISIYTHLAVPAIVLALLNIGTIIYLSNNSIKAQFQKPTPKQTTT